MDSAQVPVPGVVPGRAAAWHALPPGEEMALLATGDRGLSARDAAARLRRYGHNELQEEPPASALVVAGASSTTR